MTHKGAFVTAHLLAVVVLVSSAALGEQRSRGTEGQPFHILQARINDLQLIS